MRLFEAIIEANHRAAAGDTNAGLHQAEYAAALPIAVASYGFNNPMRIAPALSLGSSSAVGPRTFSTMLAASVSAAVPMRAPAAW